MSSAAAADGQKRQIPGHVRRRPSAPAQIRPTATRVELELPQHEVVRWRGATSVAVEVARPFSLLRTSPEHRRRKAWADAGGGAAFPSQAWRDGSSSATRIPARRSGDGDSRRGVRSKPVASSHLCLAPSPPTTARSIAAPVGAQLPHPCTKGTRTLLETFLLQHEIFLPPAAYQSILQMCDAQMLQTILQTTRFFYSSNDMQ